MTTINKIFAIFGISIIICCNSKTDDWNVTSFDQGITENDSIKLMNNLYDPEEFYDDSISVNKKTSLIIYDNDYNKNICSAKIINDTLNINLGYSTGFSSKGFNILYYNKKYKIKPYYGTDIIAITLDENGKEIPEKPSQHFFSKQKFILNKTDYKKGDSIYGFVDFSSLEINKGKKFTHKGRGYFQTVIQ